MNYSYISNKLDQMFHLSILEKIHSNKDKITKQISKEEVCKLEDFVILNGYAIQKGSITRKEMPVEKDGETYVCKMVYSIDFDRVMKIKNEILYLGLIDRIGEITRLESKITKFIQKGMEEDRKPNHRLKCYFLISDRVKLLNDIFVEELEDRVYIHGCKYHIPIRYLGKTIGYCSVDNKFEIQRIGIYYDDHISEKVGVIKLEEKLNNRFKGSKFDKKEFEKYLTIKR